MRFSIVTVCLNPGPYLDETVRSLLGQDLTDFEYLLLDGGSTDGTLEKLERFAAADQRIRWSSAPDKGIADAMNHGIREARGEVIAFLHADDRYVGQDVLSRVEAAFKAAPESLWATGGLVEIDDCGEQIRELPPRTFSYRRLLRNNIVYHPATFIRREAFERVGMFDTGLRYTMDYDLWLRLGRLSSPLRIDHPLAEFRVHTGSLSTANRRAALDEEYQVRLRYSDNRIGLWGHALYQAWRRWRV